MTSAQTLTIDKAQIIQLYHR